MGIVCTKKISEKEELIDKDIENDYYYADLIKDNNKLNIRKYIPVKIEFKDYLCIYNCITNKLLYEIFYYNIIGWKYGKYFWGINYRDSKKNELEILFKVDNNNKFCLSIKKKVNELLELNNRSDEMYKI
tara:strand:- start:237 stop:626 length:390 start_codon:yes stop_codon:yes gene_type:complete